MNDIDVVKEWIKKAEDDLEGAIHLSRRRKILRDILPKFMEEN